MSEQRLQLYVVLNVFSQLFLDMRSFIMGLKLNTCSLLLQHAPSARNLVFQERNFVAKILVSHEYNHKYKS